MDCIFKNKYIFILIVSICIFPISCGSSGDGGGGGNPLTISGVASKGPIVGGMATAFSINADGSLGAQLGTATTGPDGSFSIDIGSFSGNVLVEVTGGNYADEATGNTVPNSTTMRAAITNVTGNISMVVTPATEIAVRIAGTLTAGNIDQANQIVSTMIGGFDITTTSPVDVTNSSSSSANASEQNYGLFLATISQIVFDGTAISVKGAIAQIANDLSDNQLQSTGSNILSSLGNFISSENNQTALDLNGTDLDDLIVNFTSNPIGGGGLSTGDLAGTWYSMSINTPLSDFSDPNWFGFDFETLFFNGDGTGTITCIASSDPCGGTASISGISVSSDGIVTVPSAPGTSDDIVIGTSKDFMVGIHINNNTGSEHQIFGSFVKKADSYSMEDIAGTWYEMRIQTPQKGFSDPNRFGFDFQTITFQSDGTGTVTCNTSSDPCNPPETFSGISISGEGMISVPSGPNDQTDAVMGANKDIILALARDNSVGNESQDFSILVKKAASYSMADLAGTWYSMEIATPLKGFSDPHKFGFSFNISTIKSDGNGTNTCIRSDFDDPCGQKMVSGISISPDGIVMFPLGADDERDVVMGKNKNIMIQILRQNNVADKQQNFAIFVKKSTPTPTENKIAFETNRDDVPNDEVYVMNADGSGLINLTNHPADDDDPVWSPDGTKIAFVTDRDGNGEIYVMNADGSGLINLTNHPADESDPAWSPDGKKIAFETNRDDAINGEIYLMNVDGSGLVNLTNHPADDDDPAWSSKGTKIAFKTNRDGNNEIYVMNADGTGQFNLTNHPADDEQPSWSP